jgi:DNA-directed RNA polymerase omega subunit
MRDDQIRTAGLSSEAAVAMLGNRYDLVLVASQRVRELSRGHMPKVITKHGRVVTALLEIEAGHVGIDYLLKDTDTDRRKHKQ